MAIFNSGRGLPVLFCILSTTMNSRVNPYWQHARIVSNTPANLTQIPDPACIHQCIPFVSVTHSQYASNQGLPCSRPGSSKCTWFKDQLRPLPVIQKSNKTQL
ncbi:hypothetical protein B0J15DRAFT_289897 [Fusarium solani]|uniref:Uncharacterized protein n=1 Tax=Fusarium solani TaxID=169388 RepID=A0A9P9HKF9_FUSSL|nr:uncharacterized protein B0J15DRAFT_289897 [Fusarium solani]KAH7258084.1 hypothetical protein B0J15DRAFT_289897 [Fusarium solani]